MGSQGHWDDQLYIVLQVSSLDTWVKSRREIFMTQDMESQGQLSLKASGIQLHSFLIEMATEPGKNVGEE